MKKGKHKRFNAGERHTIAVMVDLFMKGTPERRIGEYMNTLGMTTEQVNSFLWKIEGLTQQAKDEIREAYKACHYNGPDWSRVRGRELQEWFDHQKEMGFV